MAEFSPNTNLSDARQLRAWALGTAGVLLLLSFGLFAEAVLQRKVFALWDLQINADLHDHAAAHAAWVDFLGWFTHLASTPALLIAAGIGAITLACMRQWRLALIWAVVTFGGLKLVDLLKHYYDRPRPDIFTRHAEESTRSMPSGHAAGSALLMCFTAYLLIRATRRAGWYAAPVLGLFVLAIGFSRLYLGAHWASDVVGGYMLAAGWAALGIAAAEATRER